MEISAQTQAVLLLTCWFGESSSERAQPLTASEWGRFAAWLHANGRAPADLLTRTDALGGWDDPKIPPARLGRLLERSAALAIVVERWQRAGLWIIGRSDAGYPKRLKQRLRHSAPPILYGAGRVNLLDVGGIAVVGSRKVLEEDLSFARRLAAGAAAQGRNVVSGGAKGVDEAAMLGALEAEGTAVGVLAESLLRAASGSRYRRSLMDGNLVLISPFNPEAGFNTGNAMARNKYVYGLADAAVVVASARGEGGTWAGATENLRQGWVPLWVRQSEHHAGNAALIRQGARPLPALDKLEFGALSAAETSGASVPAGSLFDTQAVDASSGEHDDGGPPQHVPPMKIAEPVAADVGQEAEQKPSLAGIEPLQDPYSLFLQRLRAETGDRSLTVEELRSRLQLDKAQLAEWLKQAVRDGHAEKLSRPVRYRAITTSQASLGF